MYVCYCTGRGETTSREEQREDLERSWWLSRWQSGDVKVHLLGCTSENVIPP